MDTSSSYGRRGLVPIKPGHTLSPSLSEPRLPVVLSPAHAAVVFAFPSVATIMPHQPAAADRKAPIMKESTMANEVSRASSCAQG